MKVLQVKKAQVQEATYHVFGDPYSRMLTVRWWKKPERDQLGRVVAHQRPTIHFHYTDSKPEEVTPFFAKEMITAWREQKKQPLPRERTISGPSFDFGAGVQIPVSNPTRTVYANAGYKQGKLTFLQAIGIRQWYADAEKVALLEHALKRHPEVFREE